MANTKKSKTGKKGRSRLGTNVDALFNPKNVVIVGANDKPGNWTERVWRNLHRYNFPGKVYPFNPNRTEIWDAKCYGDYAALPEKPDHLVVLVPARFVPDALRDAAKAGARSATVLSSGFDEIGAAGKANGRALRKAIRETGLAVSGPNCMGNIVSHLPMLTNPEDRLQRVVPGPVAICGQSGGVVIFIKRCLEERGVDTSFAVSSGNEDGLTNADYIRYFAGRPEVKVIVSYLEAIHDREGFLDACRVARAAGKPVVVLKLGTSKAGRSAALAHTGALAGTTAAFDAVAGAAGAIRVTTLDEVIEVVELAVHVRRPKSRGIGALTLSGGLRGLLLDAAERNGLEFNPLAKKSQKALEKLVGVGSAVGNPLDGGFAILTSQETYLKCAALMLKDPGVGMLIIQEELIRAPGMERREDTLHKIEAIAAKEKKPIAYFSMVSYNNNEYSVNLRRQLRHLAFLHETNKALRAIRLMMDYALDAKPAKRGARVAVTAARKAQIAKVRKIAKAADGPVTLSEPDSKALLKAYGITMPKERVVKTAAEAAAAARKIGFPVVMKGVSANLPHKTEAGAVLVGVSSAAAARKGFDAIVKNVRAYDKSVKLDGVLIAEQVSGGLELALGISNDSEVGPIVMFGQGGVALELYGDVAFAAPDLDEAKAAQLIDRTEVRLLLDGYRGQPGFDRGAAAKAIVALGALARDLGDVVREVDVNPYIARPGKKGGVALDALVVVGKDDLGTGKG